MSIRTILDSQIRPEWRRNYGSVSEGLNKLGSEKFKGAGINVLRHVVLNATLTAPFDFFNEGLYLRFGDYGFVKPLALTLASFVSALVTLPLDNARTRIMNAHPEAERNRMNYSGIKEVFMKAFIHEKGRYGLWSGFYTYFASTVMYASLTVGITSSITDSLKRANGLPEWQIW